MNHALLIATRQGAMVVPAFPTGQLAVHPTVVHSDIFFTEDWAVTHCATGYKIVALSTKESAIECAKRLEELDWSCCALESGVAVIRATEEWQERCHEILSEFLGGVR